MSLTLGNIGVDCKEPEKLRDFYAELTGWNSRKIWNCPAIIDSSGIICILFMPCDFDYAPPTWPEEAGKQQKQMHFDFQTEELSASVEKALALGATKPLNQYGGEEFVTLLDPEGHPFCLCRKNLTDQVK